MRVNELTQEERDQMLSIEIGKDLTVRDASALQILQWALKLCNNAPAFNKQVSEIQALAMAPFPGKIMSEDGKLDIVLKLKNIQAI